MYAKHCKQRPGSSLDPDSYYYNRSFPVPGRKNSGIDPLIIESLPVFRFGALRGEKDGLECAVCLNRFEPAESRGGPDQVSEAIVIKPSVSILSVSAVNFEAVVTIQDFRF